MEVDSLWWDSDWTSQPHRYTHTASRVRPTPREQRVRRTGIRYRLDRLWEASGVMHTLWLRPCLSSRAMMDLMWFSWIMFNTSGLSMRMQYSTSRMPATGSCLRINKHIVHSKPLDLTLYSNKLFTWWGLQSVQFADQPVQIVTEECAVRSVPSNQWRYRKHKHFITHLKVFITWLLKNI